MERNNIIAYVLKKNTNIPVRYWRNVSGSVKTSESE